MKPIEVNALVPVMKADGRPELDKEGKKVLKQKTVLLHPNKELIIERGYDNFSASHKHIVGDLRKLWKEITGLEVKKLDTVKSK